MTVAWERNQLFPNIATKIGGNEGKWGEMKGNSSIHSIHIGTWMQTRCPLAGGSQFGLFWSANPFFRAPLRKMEGMQKVGKFAYLKRT